ncbi:MAG: hypothetical protein Q8O67_02025 [Deltaproteobacteria bacterium]|nr:hypothetical protein [Deltaproteobacteria bacterium]
MSNIAKTCMVVGVAWSLSAATCEPQGEEHPPPTADAGEDQLVPLGTLVVLDGAGSVGDQGIDDYDWSVADSPAGCGRPDIADTYRAPLSRAFFTPTCVGAWVVRLDVEDAGGIPSETPSLVTITVVDPIEFPVADAGDDQLVSLDEFIVGLRGSGVDPFDGRLGPMEFRWVFTELPPGSQAEQTLEPIDADSPTFRPDVPGIYALELVVSVGSVESAPDAIIIAVENEPPFVFVEPRELSVLVGEPILLDASSSFDPEEAPLSFLWQLQAKPTASLCAEACFTGHLEPVTAFVADVAGVYEIALVVSDGQLTSTALITITASDPLGFPVTLLTFIDGVNATAPFVAFQDGAGPFTPLSGVDGAYAAGVFDPDGDYAFAVVCPTAAHGLPQQSSGPSSEVRAQLVFARTTELGNVVVGCRQDAARVSVSGVVTGLQPDESADVYLGAEHAFAFGSPANLLVDARTGRYDFVFTTTSFAAPAGPPRIWIERDVVVDGTALASLDVSPAAALAPAETITLAAAANGAEVRLLTERGTAVTLGSLASSVDVDFAYRGAPPNVMSAFDVHVALVATTSGSSVSFFREPVSFTTPAIPTSALEATVSLLSDEPYQRHRFTSTSTSAAQLYRFGVAAGDQASTAWSWESLVSASRFASLSFEEPDLSAVEGFDVAWGVPGEAPRTAVAEALSSSGSPEELVRALGRPGASLHGFSYTTRREELAVP